MPYEEKIIKRFWDLVDICPHGKQCAVCCWPWRGTVTRGYGVLSVYDKEHYAATRLPCRTLRAPRLACEIATGTLLPKGAWALHKCNTPLCCHYHPRHVYIGTPHDNARDTVESGHHVSQIRPDTIARGERHYNWKGGITRKWIRGNGRSKLLVRDILHIRHLAMAGFPIMVIASIFHLSHSYVSEIVAYKKRPNGA